MAPLQSRQTTIFLILTVAVTQTILYTFYSPSQPCDSVDSPFSTSDSVEPSTATTKNSIFEGRDLACYGSQGPAARYQELKERLEKALKPSNSHAFFYHSFDEPCDGCIFHKGTTFAEGKNLVTHIAMHSPAWERCKYWTFYDDDVILKMNGQNGVKANEDAWGEYHNLLLSENTTDAMIKPRDGARDKESFDTYQSCVDEHFVTFRHDHIGIFWPLTTQYKHNFWINGQFFFLRVSKCFPNGIRVVHEFFTENKEHRYNAPEYGYDTREKFQRVFDEELPELSPWTYSIKQQWQRCSVAVVPSFGWHPTCASVMNGHLNKWLSLNQSKLIVDVPE